LILPASQLLAQTFLFCRFICTGRVTDTLAYSHWYPFTLT